MTKIIRTGGDIILNAVLLVSLIGGSFLPQLANASLPTGTINKSTDGTNFSFDGNVGANQNSDLWFRWTTTGSGYCILWMDNDESNKVLISEGSSPATSAASKIDTSTVGSFHYSLRCDDPAVGGTNYVEVAGVNLTVSANTAPGQPPTTPQISQYYPSLDPNSDCVYGYPKVFNVSFGDPNGDPVQIEMADNQYHSESAVYPSPTTYYTTYGQAIGHTFTSHSSGPGGYIRPDARAIDNTGQSSNWSSSDYGVGPNYKCVNNLDEGLSGGDSDGTDIIATINGSNYSGSANVATGDTVSLTWRSALDNCWESAGPNFSVGSPINGFSAGTDSSITLPPAGESRTYSVHCTMSSGFFTQDASVTLTNTGVVVGNCSGTLPSNASAFDAEETTSVTGSLAWAYAPSDTSRKCEFQCNSGNVWNGSGCTPSSGGVTVDAGSYVNGVYSNDTVRSVGSQASVGITWDSQGASYCMVSMIADGYFYDFGQMPPDGGIGVGGLVYPGGRTYTIRCYESEYSALNASDMVMISVDFEGGAPPPPIVSLQGRAGTGSWTSGSLTVLNSQTMQLRWSSTNADYCISGDPNTTTIYDYNGNNTGVTQTWALTGSNYVQSPVNGQSKTFTVGCYKDTVNGSLAGSAQFVVTNSSPNTKPNAPTISGPATGYNQTSYDFLVKATDPDNNSLTYYYDWNDDGTADETSWNPGVGQDGPSGWQDTVSHSWNTIGSKTFSVWAVDEAGGISDKTRHTITLTTIPPISVDLKINNSDGPVNVHYSDTMNLSWSVNRTGACTLTGAGVNGWSGSAVVQPTGTMSVDASYISYAGGDEVYLLSCSGTTDSVYVDAINNNLTFEIQRNSDTWTMNSIMVGSQDTLKLRWDYSGGGFCTGTGFNTGWSTNGQVSVSPPASGLSRTFSINCGGYTASIIVTTLKSNFTTPIVATPIYGTFDPVTGSYNTVTLNFRTENNGGSPTGTAADYRLQFDSNKDGSYLGAGESVSRNGYLSSITPGSGSDETEIITGPIPTGSHNIRITVDSAVPDEVDEINESDNVYTGTLTIEPPDPGITITVDKPQVKNGDTAIIDWNVNQTYSGLSCSVSGPGLSQSNLTGASINNNSTFTTPPATSKQEYLVVCIDTNTNSRWTKTVTVEPQGELEEI